MPTKKPNAKNLPGTLTDDPKVISSMKAIQRSALWALIIGIFAPFLLILSLMSGNEPSSSLYTIPFISIYLIYSSWRMNKLKGGTSITLMLVANILLSLLLIFGIFPLLLFIMSLIALIKIRPYQKWHKQSRNTPPNIKKVTCDIHVLDPIKGEIIEEMTLDSALYKKHVSKDGRIFAIRSQKDGKTQSAIINEEVYKATRKAFGIE